MNDKTSRRCRTSVDSSATQGGSTNDSDAEWSPYALYRRKLSHTMPLALLSAFAFVSACGFEDARAGDGMFVGSMQSAQSDEESDEQWHIFLHASNLPYVTLDAGSGEAPCATTAGESSCATQPEHTNIFGRSTTPSETRAITNKLLAVERAWGAAIVDISDTYWAELGDGNQAPSSSDTYRLAQGYVDQLYAYDVLDANGNPTFVQFKPTLTREYRDTALAALYYFVGGGPFEDGGFAIKDWESVSIHNDSMTVILDPESEDDDPEILSVTAQGRYYFEYVEDGAPHFEEVHFEFGYVPSSD